MICESVMQYFWTVWCQLTHVANSRFHMIDTDRLFIGLETCFMQFVNLVFNRDLIGSFWSVRIFLLTFLQVFKTNPEWFVIGSFSEDKFLALHLENLYRTYHRFISHKSIATFSESTKIFIHGHNRLSIGQSFHSFPQNNKFF